jgi:hypothetical protein
MTWIQKTHQADYPRDQTLICQCLLQNELSGIAEEFCSFSEEGT